GPHQGPGQDH
nr:protamine mP2 intermediate protein pmP2/11 [mice, Peptide Partial, 10 aa] [Mus sp.]